MTIQTNQLRVYEIQRLDISEALVVYLCYNVYPHSLVLFSSRKAWFTWTKDACNCS